MKEESGTLCEVLFVLGVRLFWIFLKLFQNLFLELMVVIDGQNFQTSNHQNYQWPLFPHGDFDKKFIGLKSDFATP